ncbi:hypothetical protein VTN77DRAFT_3839 [Rasamsonia byssochlamydoides]|uniref:uncharacterized protein n=1 Tax=Rasamsonia byssochlamydoides TaxID=89139 RepID=UPI0037427C47
MGFLDSLLFFPSAKSGDKAPATTWSRSGSPRRSDIVPLTPQTLEKEVYHHALPNSLNIELARRLLGQERDSHDPKSFSEEHAVSPLDDAIDSVPENNDLGLDRYITAASKNPETSADTMPPSSSGTSRRARLRHKSSKGLAAVKRLLLHRRSQLGQSSFDEGKQAQSAATSFVAGSVQIPVPANTPEIPDHLFALRTDAVDNSAMRPSSPALSDSRKVSDKTVLSESSDRTTMTVCRRPSRRVASPITTVDSNYICPDAFERPSTVSRSCEPESHAHPPIVSSSVYSDDLSSRNISLSTHASDRSGSQMIYQRSPLEKSNLSLETLSQRLFSDASTQSGQYRQQRAAREFNRLAASLGLYPLVLRENSVSVASNPRVIAPEKSGKYKDNFLRKIRSMRSSLRLRHTRSRSGLGLRRMKTFASLSSRYYQMDSLRGRSLETLARLGGCSFLTLPADFAPATLRLPTCIVATVSYLKSHASKTRHVFFDSGDLRVAVRVYDHFANQVLSAERAKEKVDITMRGSDLPREALGSESDAFLRGRFHALSVACVFKQLLAGLPGGILGSVRLYRTLVDICGHEFSDREVGRSENRLAGVSSAASTRIKAIALAMLALTSDMQLELICAVFGLCALLIHETERLVELHRHRKGVRGQSGSLTGLVDRERLGRVFGPLLTGFEEDADDEREDETVRVTKMMIENWRGVSRQLRVWEVFGFPAGRK